MTEIARVVAIDGKRIQVAPLDVDVCLACSNDKCRSQGSVFTVCNWRRLPIVVGNEVRVAAPAGRQFLQGILAMGIPLLSAVLTYVLLPQWLPAVGDGLRAGLAIAVCLLTAAVITRVAPIGDEGFAEITEIL
ncbi:MAG TPA: SoxR reducing system RseC family protein [Treponema sp.]|nr:SoxR reducing system RseC family protein [Treponema sp.]